MTPSDVQCEDFDITYTRIGRENAVNSIPSPSTGSALSSPGVDGDVDTRVHEAIETFLRSLTQIGPELLSVSKLYFGPRSVDRTSPRTIALAYFLYQSQGGLTLSFFERRASRQLFGLVSNEERVM